MFVSLVTPHMFVSLVTPHMFVSLVTPHMFLSLVTPHTRCRLKLLKLERIKDYLLMEEEFIKNQERLKPQEEKQEVQFLVGYWGFVSPIGGGLFPQ